MRREHYQKLRKRTELDLAPSPHAALEDVAFGIWAAARLVLKDGPQTGLASELPDGMAANCQYREQIQERELHAQAVGGAGRTDLICNFPIERARRTSLYRPHFASAYAVIARPAAAFSRMLLMMSGRYGCLSSWKRQRLMEEGSESFLSQLASASSERGSDEEEREERKESGRELDFHEPLARLPALPGSAGEGRVNKRG